MADLCYRLIRSDRKTVALQLKGEELIVRAPARMKQCDIDSFVRAHADWIEKHRAKIREEQKKTENIPLLTNEELHALADKALAVIPPRVRYYAARMGVTYGKITVRNQRTRWGSCTAQGNLNFNCLLMLAPLPVLDSVIVHELCHRKEMNHSAAFYKEVYRAFPEYDKWHGWLKQNGPALMKRNGG